MIKKNLIQWTIMSSNRLSIILTAFIVIVVMLVSYFSTDSKRMSSDTSIITRSADTLNIKNDTVNVSLVRKNNLRWYIIEDTTEIEVSDVAIITGSEGIKSVGYLHDGEYHKFTTDKTYY